MKVKKDENVEWIDGKRLDLVDKTQAAEGAPSAGLSSCRGACPPFFSSILKFSYISCREFVISNHLPSVLLFSDCKLVTRRRRHRHRRRCRDHLRVEQQTGLGGWRSDTPPLC